MRSCDFSTHFPNDVYLAIKLLEYIAGITGYEVGSFTHTIFSLHVYRKDLKEVF
jgi:thymidylate synthase